MASIAIEEAHSIDLFNYDEGSEVVGSMPPVAIPSSCPVAVMVCRDHNQSVKFGGLLAKYGGEHIWFNVFMKEGGTWCIQVTTNKFDQGLPARGGHVYGSPIIFDPV